MFTRSGTLFLTALAMLNAACPSATTKKTSAKTPVPVAKSAPVEAGSPAQAEFDKAFDLFAQSKWAEAEKGFAGVVARNPKSGLIPEARYRRGVCLNRLQKYAEGREALREVLEKHPTSSYAKQASVELALAESRLGNKHDAEQILRPVMNDPGSMTAEQRAEVAGTLDEVIASGSGTLEAIRRATKALVDAEDDAAKTAAREDLERLVDTKASFLDMAQVWSEAQPKSPAYPIIAAKMARIFYHLGDLERAKDAAQKATKQGGAFQDRVQEVVDRISLRNTTNPMKIGAILPLTGKFKTFGEAIQDGIGLAIAKRDGIEISTKDSQGDPDRAVAAVEELVREGATVILGPVSVAEAAPAAVRAQELGIPMLSLSRTEGITAIGTYIFRNSLTNSQQGKALARYASEVLKSRAAAVLAPDIASGEEVSGAFWEGMEQAGGEISGYELYSHDQTTFSGPVKRLVARNNLDEREEFRSEVQRISASESNPYKRKKLLEKLASTQAPVIDFDVMLVPDYYRTVGLVAPALAVEDIITNGCNASEMEKIKKTTKRDVRTVTLLGTAGWNNPELVTRAGKYVQCSVFVDGFFAGSAREATKKFVDDFDDQYGRKPGLLEAQGFDSARIVRQIMVDKRPNSREKFRDALLGVKKFPGATGETTFGPDREADKPLFFLTIEKGAIVELPDVLLSPGGVAVPRGGS